MLASGTMIAGGRNFIEVCVRVASGWPHLLALSEGKDEKPGEEEEDRDPEPLVQGHHAIP